jgi:PAS domain S-box-containing protein
VRKPLSILMLEDDPRDAKLIEECLLQDFAGCRIRCIETKEALISELRTGTFDVVLADGNLPTFNGIEALRIVRERHSDLPFIFVSGSIGEDLASEMLKMGATDFIPKNRLSRLPPSVLRAVNEAEARAERQRAEKALRESEERYRRLFEDAPAPMFINCGGNIVNANSAAAKVLGAANARELQGVPHLDIVHPDCHEIVRTRIRTTLEERREVPLSELKWLTRDGKTIFVEAAAIPTTYVGQPAMHVIFADVSERKRAERARAEAEEKYRSIVENAVEGIFQATLDDRYLMVNPALAAMLGYESVAELMACVTDVKQHFAHAEQLEQAKSLLAREGVLRSFEFEMRRKDGSAVWVASTVRAVRDAQGNVAYVEGMAKDISERKRLEDQLRQAQKMEAVGQLAGGVAHDFNNILTAIIGYSEFLAEALGRQHPQSNSVGEIRKAADRAASLTRQLLAFSRKQVLQPKVLDLNTVVADMEKMLRRLIGEDIEVVVTRTPKLGRVNADPGQLEQVLMNLVVNARDAMPKGGTLSIQTDEVDIDAAYAESCEGMTPGPYVRLTVSDTGEGMDATTKARIFEPFFTTKGPGKGTGLGLSTVYGIMRQSNGHVTVYSELGRGSSFNVYLPRVADQSKSAGSSAGDNRSRMGGSETLLLVEDDDVVRRLTQRILEKHGYRVIFAENPDVALSAAGQFKEEIDLLVTDVVMPSLTGRDLAEVLASVRPKMKVLYMSGYNDNVIGKHGILDRGVHFLPKPFTLEDLLEKVRLVLDTPLAVRSETDPKRTPH